VTVWAGICSRGILGPVFFDDTVNSANYCAMLRETIITEIKQKYRGEEVWFQHDGAPAHTAQQTTELLNQHFPGKWVGINGPTQWPPRSPDLTPPDFFLWDYLRDNVYNTNPQSIEILKDRIREEINNIPIVMCKNVCDDVSKRLEECINRLGNNVEF
jgi:hypothetical protein